MAVNLSGWQQGLATKIAAAKSDFLDALSDDENFIDAYQSEITPSPKNTYTDPLVIALADIDAIQESLDTATFVLPDLPPALANPDTQKYKDHVFYDQKLDDMEAKAASFFSGFDRMSGFSFSAEDLQTAVQDALYSYEYELDEEDLKTKLDGDAFRWAADGYEKAPGAMSYQMAQSIAAFDRERTNKTRTTFGQLAETIQQNMQWSYENGIAIERLHMDFAIKYSEMSKQLIEASIDAYIAEIDKRKQELFAQLKKSDDLVRALRIDVTADIKELELELNENNARLSASISNFAQYISARASLIQDQIAMANNIKDGYEAIFSTYGAAFIGVSYEKQDPDA